MEPMDLITLKSLIGKTLIPAAEDMTTVYVIAVVITGLTVVFLGLIILILFVWAFGKIFTRKKSVPESPKSAEPPKPAVQTVAKPSANTDSSDEVIAVIAAAIAAMGSADGKKYRLRSMKAVKNKPVRSAWSMAGIQNDTDPF